MIQVRRVQQIYKLSKIAIADIVLNVKLLLHNTILVFIIISLHLK